MYSILCNIALGKSCTYITVKFVFVILDTTIYGFTIFFIPFSNEVLIMKNTNKYKLTNLLILLSIILNVSISSADENIIIGENHEIIKLSQKYKHLKHNFDDLKFASVNYLTILDSIKYDYTPQVFYYNSKNQLDSAVVPFQNKYVTKFDSNDNLILEEYYENWGTGDTILWAGTKKHEYVYDDKNRISISTEFYPKNEYSPNFNVTWYPLSKLKYNYINSTNKLDSYYSKTNFSTNDTLFETMYLYEYLSSQNIIYRKSWDDKTKSYGESDYKYVTDFNSNNKVTLVSHYKKNTINEWVIFEQQGKYIYDDEDKLVTIIQTYIDNSKIKNISKIDYFYNANNQIESKIYFIHSNFYNDWVKETNTLYSYDEKGNITQEILQKWNTGLEKWIDQTKIVTIIDNDVDLEYLITSPKVDKKILNITNYKNFSVENPKWEIQNEANYHYSELLITSIENSINQNVVIYPNPASKYIEINLESYLSLQKSRTSEIKIYNYLGKCVMEDYQNLGDFGQLKRIDISHLPVGLYFILIGNYTEKFVVVK